MQVGCKDPFTNSADSQDVWGKVLLIGGGPCCQYLYREITEKVLEGMGVGMLPDEAFATTPFPTDWLDSAESQRLLQYQRHTLDDYEVLDLGVAPFSSAVTPCLGWSRFISLPESREQRIMVPGRYPIKVRRCTYGATIPCAARQPGQPG